MSISKYILLVLHFSVYACNDLVTLTSASNVTRINLAPLSPYQYEFTTKEVEKNAINYFFTERKNWQSKPFRKELGKKLETIQLKVSENYQGEICTPQFRYRNQALALAFTTLNTKQTAQLASNLASYRHVKHFVITSQRPPRVGKCGGPVFFDKKMSYPCWSISY